MVLKNRIFGGYFDLQKNEISTKNQNFPIFKKKIANDRY
jgi:hypothetical protein